MNANLRKCFLTLFYVFLIGSHFLLPPTLLFAKSTPSELRDKAGQLLWVGYHSLEQIQKLKPSGVMYFGWNIRTAYELRDSISQLRKLESEKKLPPFITAIDHEGGNVTRLQRGLSYFPDAKALAASNDTELIQNVSYVMGRELRITGVDVNFAPVLDLGDARSFLENRVWGDNAEDVTKFTRAFIAGHLEAGVMPLPKHFPGHGVKAAQDSHFLTPFNPSTYAELKKNDFSPFQKLFSFFNLTALMMAHVELTAIDRQPASLSSRVMHDVLRNRLGYKGLILTDDLEMGALESSTSNNEIPEIAIKSLKSGADSVMIVWSQDLQLKVRDRIVKAMQSGELSELDVDEKILRIKNLKTKIAELKKSTQKVKADVMQNRPELASEAWARSREWILGSEVEMKKQLEEHFAMPWLVYLPASYKKQWLKVRPQDEVKELSELSKFNEEKFIKKSNRPLFMLTPPLHKDKAMGIRSVITQMNKLYKNPLLNTPVIWAHMGAKPIKLKSNSKPSKPFSLVLLNSSTALGLRNFLKMLSSGESTWNSVSQRSSSF